MAELDAEGKLWQAFQAEVEGLRNWYDVAVQQRGRTTADTTGLTPEGVADFIAAFARGEEPENPLSEVPLGTALKMASEDLKAYYNESVTAQPSRATDLVSLANWFWGEAAAARVLNQVRKHCLRREGQEYQRLGNGLLVPRRQLHRFEAQLTVVYLSSPRRCSGGVEEALELGVSVSILSCKGLSSSLRHRHCRVQQVRCHCPNGDRAIQRTRWVNDLVRRAMTPLSWCARCKNGGVLYHVSVMLAMSRWRMPPWQISPQSRTSILQPIPTTIGTGA